MQTVSKTRRSRGRDSMVTLLLAGIAALSPQMTWSADRSIAAGTSSFDCSSVAAGDTLTLAAGTRGPLAIKNCTGSTSAPIVIQNDPDSTGPTVIRRSTGNEGGFVFECVNCVGVVIDGSAKWNGAPSGTTYGIKVTMTGGGSPASFLKLSGLSRNVTIRNVEVDGAWPRIATNGIGIQIKDATVLKSAHPGLWREGITVDNNYVHDVEGEGMYIGANWPVGELPLRNVEIRNNLVEDTGWDGMQIKSAISGANRIHDNVLRRVGKRRDKGQLFGISLLDGNGTIYANRVERSGDTGIQHFLQYLPRSYGDQPCEIYNNVVVEPGQAGVMAGHGIVSANQSGYARPVPTIYNNTIVRPRDSGIRVGGEASGGFIRDNIVTDAGATPLTAPSPVAALNNRIGSATQIGYADAVNLDFRLKATSPARDAGSSSYPAVDIDGVRRPQDGASDQGAHEYHLASTDDARPNPPVIVSVQ